MVLSDSQKTSVAEWVSEGLKLSDIQSRINESFGSSLTYMDVRFLIDDLELDLKDQPKPVDNDLRNAPQPPPTADENPAEEGMDTSNREDGGVSVSLHRVYKPGSVVSGEVVFTDGENAVWALDQAGHLSLEAATEAYKPGEVDLQDFQKKLSGLLQNQEHSGEAK